MRFLKVSDSYYLTKNGLAELKEKYNSKKIEPIFGKDEVLNFMKSDDIEYIDFVTFFLPENLHSDFSNVEMVRVPNKFGLLTKEQKERNLSPFEVLEKEIGAKIYEPKVTFADYVIDRENENFKDLMSQVRSIKIKKRAGLVSKGFFLTGVPGTGKTFFAKCVAGELNRYLIHLNLSIFINSNDTFGLLANFFDFFKYNDGEYVVLIDEIEKMLTGNNLKTKQVLGYLLTALNDFGEVEYRSEVFFIATANNITDLALENPELFRKGRFDMSIYLTAPNRSKATDIFAFYIKQLNKKFKTKTFPFLVETAYDILSKGISSYFLSGSKASNIVNEICQNEIFAKKSNELSQSEILNEPSLKEFYAKLMESNLFDLNILHTINNVFITYRKLMVDNELFPYVPAEIEQMLTEIFRLQYFDKGEIDYIKYFKANTPIQLSMKEGILKMNSATQNFTRF